jgi:hypothetical protein
MKLILSGLLVSSLIVNAYAFANNQSHTFSYPNPFRCQPNLGSCEHQLNQLTCKVTYERTGNCGGHNCVWNGSKCETNIEPCFYDLP